MRSQLRSHFKSRIAIHDYLFVEEPFDSARATIDLLKQARKQPQSRKRKSTPPNRLDQVPVDSSPPKKKVKKPTPVKSEIKEKPVPSSSSIRSADNTTYSVSVSDLLAENALLKAELKAAQKEIIDLGVRAAKAEGKLEGYLAQLNTQH